MNVSEGMHFTTPPLMLAAWPGMGNVGIMAMDYVRRKLDAQPFGQIDMTALVVPESIVVNEGVARLPDTPQSVFYRRHTPDLVFFESTAQVNGKDGMEVLKTVIEIARTHHVNKIYTAAAYPLAMSHASESQIFYACNNELLAGELLAHGIEPMPDGTIGGLNGLLLGLASVQGIDAVCFLGTIPTYASTIPYPKATLEVVRALSNMTETDIDLDELEENVAETDGMFDEIEQRLRELFTSIFDKEEEETSEVKEDEVPKLVLNRIETLFKTVASDRAQAGKLREELVRWNLFELYEDRFLDLFEDDSTT